MQSYPMSEYGPIEEVRAGIDWISCTLGAEVKDRWTWANECVKVMLDVGKQGYDLREAGLMGYKGIMVGGCFAGDRDDGSYLQLSGAHAQAYLERILRPDLHVSRLDLTVTCRFVVMPRDLGSSARREATKAAESTSDSSRRRKIYTMEGTDGGFTLYIGSPSSSQRGRLYNKEVQSDTPDYAKCWRWEVVLKNALAMAVLRPLSSMPAHKVPSFCGLLVAEWYRARGVPCPWPTGNDDITLPVIKSTPSDATKKLVWLETQVAPAFRWLCQHGYENEALYALGMDKLSIDGFPRGNYKREE